MAATMTTARMTDDGAEAQQHGRAGHRSSRQATRRVPRRPLHPAYRNHVASDAEGGSTGAAGGVAGRPRLALRRPGLRRRRGPRRRLRGDQRHQPHAHLGRHRPPPGPRPRPPRGPVADGRRCPSGDRRRRRVGRLLPRPGPRRPPPRAGDRPSGPHAERGPARGRRPAQRPAAGRRDPRAQRRAPEGRGLDQRPARDPRRPRRQPRRPGRVDPVRLPGRDGHRPRRDQPAARRRPPRRGVPAPDARPPPAPGRPGRSPVLRDRRQVLRRLTVRGRPPRPLRAQRRPHPRRAAGPDARALGRGGQPDPADRRGAGRHPVRAPRLHRGRDHGGDLPDRLRALPELREPHPQPDHRGRGRGPLGPDDHGRRHRGGLGRRRPRGAGRGAAARGGQGHLPRGHGPGPDETPEAVPLDRRPRPAACSADARKRHRGPRTPLGSLWGWQGSSIS